MNNFRKYSMMFLVVAMSTIAVTSCGGDDDPILGSTESTTSNNNSSGNSGNSNQGSGTGVNSGLHEYVDLGLPSGTLWATCNIGASKPEEFGLYFAWGETVGYTNDTSDGHIFDWSTYKWCNGSENNLTKYCLDSTCGTVDNKSILDPEDDAATVNWGKEWCMPTHEQANELCSKKYCTFTTTTINGVYGKLITSNTNGNTLFLPAAGGRAFDLYAMKDVEGLIYGGYWTRTLHRGNSAYVFEFRSEGRLNQEDPLRISGLTIRPVRTAK